MIQLFFKTQTGVVRSIDLSEERPTITIGRNPDCTIQTSRPSVSRVHAIITLREDRLFVTNPPNVHTTNGTWVDGIRLMPNEELELCNRLMCGDFEVCVEGEMPMSNSEAIKYENLSPAESYLPTTSSALGIPSASAKKASASQDVNPALKRQLEFESLSTIAVNSPVKPVAAAQAPSRSPAQADSVEVEAPPVKLTYCDDEGTVRTVELDCLFPNCTIGRSKTCTVQTNDVTVFDVQTEIIWREGKLFVKDRSNGYSNAEVLVDGLHLHPGCELELIGELQCGSILLYVEDESEEQPDEQLMKSSTQMVDSSLLDPDKFEELFGDSAPDESLTANISVSESDLVEIQQPAVNHYAQSEQIEIQPPEASEELIEISQPAPVNENSSDLVEINGPDSIEIGQHNTRTSFGQHFESNSYRSQSQLPRATFGLVAESETAKAQQRKPLSSPELPKPLIHKPVIGSKPIVQTVSEPVLETSAAPVVAEPEKPVEQISIKVPENTPVSLPHAEESQPSQQLSETIQKTSNRYARATADGVETQFHRSSISINSVNREITIRQPLEAPVAKVENNPVKDNKPSEKKVIFHSPSEVKKEEAQPSTSEASVSVTLSYYDNQGNSKTAVLNEDKPIILIGSAPECQIRYDDEHISGIHAIIILRNGYMYAQELTKKGHVPLTSVDGWQLIPGEERRFAKELRCGMLCLRVRA